MAEYLINGETLTGIADAIRTKEGTTDPIAVSDFASRIGAIQAGGDEYFYWNAFRVHTEFDEGMSITFQEITTFKNWIDKGYKIFGIAHAIGTVSGTGITYCMYFEFEYDPETGWTADGRRGLTTAVLSINVDYDSSTGNITFTSGTNGRVFVAANWVMHYGACSII